MALMSHSDIVGRAVRTISRFTSSKSCWFIPSSFNNRFNNTCDDLYHGFFRVNQEVHRQGQLDNEHSVLLSRSGKPSITLQQVMYYLSCAVLLIGATLMMSSKAMAEDGIFPPNVHPPGGSHDGVKVEQPIEFPHNIHVKVNKINCMYCHTYARRSKVAGIPPTSKCIGCHKVIATDKPRIQKLTQYWENREPPRWKKVHDVPDFVHFTHEKHLKKFVFDPGFPVENVKEVCAFCHGQLQEMTVANKVKPLNMGWCKNCHIENGGPGDCWKCHK